MRLLKKFFQFSKTQEESKDEVQPEAKPLVDFQDKTIDEVFTINFRNNGGKFLYCETLEEVYENFEYILLENNWKNKDVLCLNEKLRTNFKNFPINLSDKEYAAPCFFSRCEFLVADTGAILVSSEQIKEKNIKDYPDHFIIFATTSQLVKTISDGLRGIKKKHPNKIPSNITTIKNFEDVSDNDFMTYGSSSKKLYLLLFEDLLE